MFRNGFLAIRRLSCSAWVGGAGGLGVALFFDIKYMHNVAYGVFHATYDKITAHLIASLIDLVSVGVLVSSGSFLVKQGVKGYQQVSEVIKARHTSHEDISSHLDSTQATPRTPQPVHIELSTIEEEQGQAVMLDLSASPSLRFRTPNLTPGRLYNMGALPESAKIKPLTLHRAESFV